MPDVQALPIKRQEPLTRPTPEVIQTELVCYTILKEGSRMQNVSGLVLGLGGGIACLLVSGGPTVTDPAITNSMILGWCLMGAFFAAMFSVWAWPPKVETFPRGMLGMFGANIAFGFFTGPALSKLICRRLEWELDMGNCMIISGLSALLAFSVVRPAGPILTGKLIALIESLEIPIPSWLKKVGIKTNQRLREEQANDLLKTVQDAQAKQDSGFIVDTPATPGSPS